MSQNQELIYEPNSGDNQGADMQEERKFSFNDAIEGSQYQ
jgi:hypothetical protein